MKQKENSYRIIALGCRTNQYEGQAFRDQLDRMGFSPAADGAEADVCIVNTCTVTQSADAASRHEIRKIRKENPHSKILVTGCSAERDPETYQRMEGVDFVVPNKEKEKLLSHLFPEMDLPEFSITRFEAHTRAFVKVQDGCNSFCTYCIIPYVRGRSHSRSIPAILEEVRRLVSHGYKEIVLTGINIGDFDGNPAEGEEPARLSDLIRAVDEIPGVERIRVSSIDPDEVDDDLSGAILLGKHTAPSMHVVLQSGSNVVLKRMNRKYTRQIFLQTVERLRQAHPDFTFTTDIIVGFPGETEVDFEETLQMMRDVQFAKVHMFPYSDRPRTRAFLYPDKVPSEIIQGRKQKTLQVAEQEAYALREQFVGRRMMVLTEEKEAGRPHEIFGHTENFLGVWIQNASLQPNELVEVELAANTPEGFVGLMVRQEQEQKVESCA